MKSRSMEKLGVTRRCASLIPFLAFAIVVALGGNAKAWDIDVDANPIYGGFVKGSSASYSTSGIPATGAGNWVQLSATPGTNYHFVQWMAPFGDEFQFFSGSSTSTAIRVMSTNDTYVYLQAMFAVDSVSLTMVSGVGGTTEPTGTVSVGKGTAVGIRAYPLPGYSFGGWSGTLIANTASDDTTVTMDISKTVTASFSPVLSYTGYDPSGPGTAPVFTNLMTGQQYTANVLVSHVMLNPSQRQYCVGWLDGAGNIPASGPSLSYGPFIATLVSSNRWVWTNEYRVTVQASTGADVVDYLGTNWVTEGEVLTLNAHPLPGYVFTGWQVGSSNVSGTLTLTVDGPKTVAAYFSALGSDSDGDGLPDAWERDFGLDPLSASGNDGRNGDPDRDGLSNFEEYRLQNTNRNWFASPINADSDGDGMDDYYERYSIDATNITAEEAVSFISAVIDDGDFILNNGPLGNPDGDYKWSTVSGYRLTSDPLRNEAEWRGPDLIDPCSYSNVVFGNPLYPFTSNRGLDVNVKVQNPLDTDDQSRGNMTDSDADIFDDGFEYTWDQWQQSFQGTNEVFVYGVTNREVLTLTNTVPAWDGVVNVTRKFNPKHAHADASGTAAGSDQDVLYDYLTGGVSMFWYSDLMEYNASADGAFSPTIVGVPHSIRRDQPPSADDPPRSSHPFLIDVDGDLLPDGYEVIFGYDPWASTTPGSTMSDAMANPDNDFMAMVATNTLVSFRHHEVYVTNGYNPYTAWGRFYPRANEMPGAGATLTPDTATFVNREEMWGSDGVLMLTPRGSWLNTDDASHPFKLDSDADGIWDGWECYVGLNPNDAGDAPLRTADNDQLNNLEEFQSFITSSTNRGALAPLSHWMNKIFPTDPNDADTDADQLADHEEMGFFNGGSTLATNIVVTSDTNGVPVTNVVVAPIQWVGSCYPHGGLNPTCSDTDYDTLPDPYERCYTTAIDGTLGDELDDPDGDKLPNYLEYLTSSTTHWQYDRWVPGQFGYNLGDFFEGQPYAWDWNDRVYIPALSGMKSYCPYSGSDPGMVDTDLDEMDDYWEVYHGLNPAMGTIDLVCTRYFQSLAPIPVPSLPSPIVVADPRILPYVSGTPSMDVDGDGLPNDKEAVSPNYNSASPSYHTDPSPLWVTDTSYARSWANLYYSTFFATVWHWAPPGIPPPDYIYDFEANEGFDTDNDNISDYKELNETYTDPMTPESPIKRRALYLPPGLDAYARTSPSYYYSWDVLRTYTVEAWVRPLNPVSGQRQVIVERVLGMVIGNPLEIDYKVMVNFRLALDPAGVPYVEYTGDGDPVIFTQAKAASAMPLPATNWTHLAGTYELPVPNVRPGRLTLYVNGRVAQSINSSELPAVGRLGNLIPFQVYGAAVVVGAADLNPAGTALAVSVSPPVPQDFFKGWIDEVRVWDGPRTQPEILAGMKHRMKQSDVLAYATNTTYEMIALYSFDDLPDPDHSPVSPDGFDVVMMNNRPSDWYYYAYWGTAPERSLRYTDYSYVPWIENSVAHMAEVPPCDIGDPANRVNPPTYPNRSNPYGSRHFTAPHILDEIGFTAGTYYESAYVTTNRTQLEDLLPLRWAEADEDVPMWDGGGAPADTPFDSDGDGLPDEWEERYGLDPLSATGADGAWADFDGDSVPNLIEYLCGTSPSSVNTDGDNAEDGVEDSDGDGLSNYDEMYVYMTHPGNPDSDDDGVSDGDELDSAVVKADGRRVTNPLDSRSPLVQKSMVLNGTPVVVPDMVIGTNRFNTSSWTLEAWVKPATSNETGAVISRVLSSGQTNFALRLVNNQPVVEFATSEGQRYYAGGNAVIPSNAWTHLAGVWDAEHGSLALYVNGVAFQSQRCLELPAQGEGTTTLGSGLRGWLDEVRFWDAARSGEEVFDNIYRFGAFMIENASNVVTYAGVRFLDGDLAFADTIHRYIAGANDGMDPNANMDPTKALGPPDGQFVSLGVSDLTAVQINGIDAWTWTVGFIELKFTDNRLKTSGDSRPDLYIFESASRPDSMMITISPDGDQWMNCGFTGGPYISVTNGSVYAIDIDRYVGTNPQEFQYVRLVDSASNVFSTVGMPGADIDAVGAANYPSKKPVAWYPFDDGRNEGVTNAITGQVTDYGAEDFSHRLDWRYAIVSRDVVFDANSFAPMMGEMDGDDDGMADWWEGLFFTSAYSAAPDEDSDADGLNNLYEYWVDTNPKDGDTDNDGALDSQEDFDGDGLSNVQEQEIDSRPDLTDTDDDGILDGVEVGVHTLPSDALSPLVDRVLQVGGGGYVEMPDDVRFRAGNWTVGAWVKPSALTNGLVIGRQVESNVWNYNLSLDAGGRLIAMFTPGDRTANVSVTAGVTVAAGEWTHVAASFDSSNRVLSVYVNGVVRGLIETAKQPAVSGVGPTWTRAGLGLEGWIDEVAMYGASQPTDVLQATMAGVAGVTNAYAACYYRFDDGTTASGTSGHPSWRRGQVQEFAEGFGSDWMTGWRNAGTLVGSASMVLAPVDAPVEFATMDLDCNGLPDGWESQNSLASGSNAAYADPDGDGLCNLYEYFAGTNPNLWDTDNDGFSDYDSRNGPGDRTFGELYDDGDGIPDEWEIRYRGPCAATGKRGLDPTCYDANLDPDEDGWSNYAEYMSGTDPLQPLNYPNPVISVHGRYYGRHGNTLDDAFTRKGLAIVGIANEPQGPFAPGDLSLQGQMSRGGIIPGSVVFWDGGVVVAQDNGNGILSGSRGTGVIDYGTGAWYLNLNATVATLTASYQARLTGQFKIMFYRSPTMDGWPIGDLALGTPYADISSLDSGHVVEGANYLFAYLDRNDNNQYDPDLEPAGIGQFLPINIGWGTVNDVEIGLTDAMPGYPRFRWDAVPEMTSYHVTNAIAQGVQRNVMVPRNYWHEGDWLSQGRYGAPTGTLVFLISTNVPIVGYYTNVVVTVPSVSLTTPIVVTPHDTVFQYARNEIEFRRDTNATAYRFQIALATNLAPVLTTTNIVPYMDINGVSKAALPIFAGDNYVPTNDTYAAAVWTNGRYWVRVQALTMATSSSYSPWSAINFNLKTPIEGGQSMIGGDLYYFGKVGHGYGAGQTNYLTMIVQAFASPGFSGVAEGQVQVSYACNTNLPSSNKGAYTLMGLGSKPYYIRAFIDMNGNRILDPFEPMGFAKESLTTTDYRPLAVDLSGQAGVAKSGIRIVIRDRDTDDDQLPDGWEWMYYGTLVKGAYDVGANTLTLLRNYEIEPLDLDPTKIDFDGDGLDDVFEIGYSEVKSYSSYQGGQIGNMDHYNPYDPSLNPDGTDLNPTKWDTDGDGLSDGYELMNGLDPLDPMGDADGDGVSDAREVLLTRTSPVSAADALSVKQIATVTPGAGLFSLTWAGKDGVSYQVQYSDNLKDWSDAPGGVFTGEADHIYVEQSPAVSVRFYRVVVK